MLLSLVLLLWDALLRYGLLRARLLSVGLLRNMLLGDLLLRDALLLRNLLLLDNLLRLLSKLLSLSLFGVLLLRHSVCERSTSSCGRSRNWRLGKVLRGNGLTSTLSVLASSNTSSSTDTSSSKSSTSANTALLLLLCGKRRRSCASRRRARSTRHLTTRRAATKARLRRVGAKLSHTQSVDPLIARSGVLVVLPSDKSRDNNSPEPESSPGLPWPLLSHPGGGRAPPSSLPLHCRGTASC